MKIIKWKGCNTNISVAQNGEMAKYVCSNSFKASRIAKPSCKTQVCTPASHLKFLNLPYSTLSQMATTNSHLDTHFQNWWPIQLYPQSQNSASFTYLMITQNSNYRGTLTLFLGLCMVSIITAYDRGLVSYSKILSISNAYISNKEPFQKLQPWSVAVHDKIYWEVLWASQELITWSPHVMAQWSFQIVNHFLSQKQDKCKIKICKVK